MQDKRTEVEGKDSSTTKPIYIGKHMKEPIYYFVSVKESVVRFLRFGFSPYYPFWVGGVNTGATHCVPDKLSPVPCPMDVWEEVNLFIEGKISYNVVPSKRGSKSRVQRIVPPKPELDSRAGGQDVCIRKTNNSGKGRDESPSCSRSFGENPKNGDAVSTPKVPSLTKQDKKQKSSSVEPTQKVDKTKVVKAITVKDKSLKMMTSTIEEKSTINQDKVKKHAKTELKARESTIVEPLKRGRGRPRKILNLPPGISKASK